MTVLVPLVQSLSSGYLSVCGCSRVVTDDKLRHRAVKWPLSSCGELASRTTRGTRRLAP